MTTTWIIAIDTVCTGITVGCGEEIDGRTVRCTFDSAQDAQDEIDESVAIWGEDDTESFPLQVRIDAGGRITDADDGRDVFNPYA